MLPHKPSYFNVYGIRGVILVSSISTCFLLYLIDVQVISSIVNNQFSNIYKPESNQNGKVPQNISASKMSYENEWCPHNLKRMHRSTESCDGYHEDLKGFIIHLYRAFSHQLLDPEDPRPKPGNNHFYPQHWHCKVQWHYEDYNERLICDPTTVKLGKQLMSILERRNVSIERQANVKMLLQSYYHPAGESKKTNLLQTLANDWKMLDCVLKIYHEDYMFYQLFNDKYYEYQALLDRSVHDSHNN